MEKVEEIKDLLQCNSDKAIQILKYFKWDNDKLINNWFDQEHKLKHKIGIDFDTKLPISFPYINGTLRANNQGFCSICYSKFDHGINKVDSLACGHEFCASDWKLYLVQQVNNGFAKCMETTCPQYMCNMVVPHSQFLKYLNGDDIKTYMKWFCKSFTDDNKSVRWCPFQGCDYCVEYQEYGVSDVQCKCGNSFCFKCS